MVRIPHEVSMHPPLGMGVHDVLAYYMSCAPSGTALERDWHVMRTHVPQLLGMKDATLTARHPRVNGNEEEEGNDYGYDDDDDDGGGHDVDDDHASSHNNTAADDDNDSSSSSNNNSEDDTHDAAAMLHARWQVDPETVLLYFLIVGAKDTLQRTRAFFTQYVQIDKQRSRCVARVHRQARRRARRRRQEEQQPQGQQSSAAAAAAVTSEGGDKDATVAAMAGQRGATSLARQAHNRVVAYTLDAYTRVVNALSAHFAMLCAHVLWPLHEVQMTLVAHYVLRVHHDVVQYSPLPARIADEYTRARAAQYRQLYKQWVVYAEKHGGDYAAYLLARQRGASSSSDNTSNSSDNTSSSSSSSSKSQVNTECCVDVPTCDSRVDCRRLVRYLEQYVQCDSSSSSSTATDARGAALARWAAHVLDEKNPRAWLPCEVVADRVSFNTGFVRITPHHAAPLLRRLLRWMNVSTAELPAMTPSGSHTSTQSRPHHHSHHSPPCHDDRHAAVAHEDSSRSGSGSEDDEEEERHTAEDGHVVDASTCVHTHSSSSSGSCEDNDEEGDNKSHDSGSSSSEDEDEDDHSAVSALSRSFRRAHLAAAADVAVGLLTVLSPHGRVMELQLTNPLLISTAPGSGYDCDACCRTHVRVSYQAILHTDVRDTLSLYRDAVGYDMCVACAVHVYKAALQRLLRALHPSPQWRRPFAHGAHVQLRLWSLTVSRATITTVTRRERGEEEGAEAAAEGVGDGVDDNVTRAAATNNEEAVMTVHMYVGVSPAELCVTAWQLPDAKLRQLSRACATADDDDADLRLTEAMWRALPVPPSPRPTTAAGVMTATAAACAHDDHDGGTSRGGNNSSSDTHAVYCSVTRAQPSWWGSSGDGSGGSSSVSDSDATLAVDKASSLFSADDVCVICLQPLAGPTPTQQTSCHHWFHVSCLHKLINTQPAQQRATSRTGNSGSNNDNSSGGGGGSSSSSGGGGDAAATQGPVTLASVNIACPMCRCTPCLPAKVPTADELVRSNVYRVELRIRCPVTRTSAMRQQRSEADGGGSSDVVVPAQHVAVAALLSRDGVYHNPTNVAACCTYALQPRHLLVCAEDNCHTSVSACVAASKQM